MSEDRPGLNRADRASIRFEMRGRRGVVRRIEAKNALARVGDENSGRRPEVDVIVMPGLLDDPMLIIGPHSEHPEIA